MAKTEQQIEQIKKLLSKQKSEQELTKKQIVEELRDIHPFLQKSGLTQQTKKELQNFLKYSREEYKKNRWGNN